MDEPSVRKGLESSVHEVLDKVDDSTLGPDNCFEVESEVMDVAHRWQQFGRALRIRQAKLDEIKTELCSAPRECLSKTVQEFLKKNYDWQKHGEPSWRLVVIAVGHKAGGADTDLALQLANDHPVKASSKKKSDSVSVHDFSLLMEASRTGDVETAKMLLDHGADPSLANNEGWTALMAAARNGQYGTVNLLLERGADPNMQDHSGWSALMAAVFQRHDEVSLRIIKAGATPHLQDKNKTNAVLLAIGRNNKEKVINALLDSNPDVDLQDSYGETALMFACKMSNFFLVKRLLGMGANPNIGNNDGESPALIAIAKREKDILKELLINGANPNTGVANDAPGLILAAQIGANGIVDLLLTHGADPNQQTKSGITASQVAETSNHTELARKLNPQQVPSPAPLSLLTATLSKLASISQHLTLGPLFLDPETGKTEDSYGLGFLGKVFEKIIP